MLRVSTESSTPSSIALTWNGKPAPSDFLHKQLDVTPVVGSLRFNGSTRAGGAKSAPARIREHYTVPIREHYPAPEVRPKVARCKRGARRAWIRGKGILIERRRRDRRLPRRF